MKLKLKEFVLENEAGGKVKISFDGTFSPEDIMTIIGKLNTESPTPDEKKQSTEPSPSIFKGDRDSLTIREKLEEIVNEIKHGWFTSDHIRELYLYHYQEEIKPSTVSTYLARMFNEASLERRGSRARREYRVAEKLVKPIQLADQL